MGSADRIADTILRMGQIRAEGLQRSADIQARAQQNNAQIWSGALQSLGQLPVDIQKAKVLETENKARQTAQRQQEETIAAGHRADAVVQNLFTKDDSGALQIDPEKMQQMSKRFAEQGIPLDMQTRYMGMFKGASDLMADFRKDQIATQGKLADFVLSHVKPGEELTPGAGLTVLKMAQAAHIATTDDVNKYMAAMQQGQKPEDLYKAIKQYSMGGQVAKPPSNESELAYRAAQGDPVAIDAMNRAHPQKPPEPAKGFTNETELRQDAATQGTSAETPTAWQSVETLRQMDEAKAKAPAAGKSLQQKTVMLDGKRKEVLFDPDPNATQKVFDLDGKPITNAAQRISGLPTAAEQRPEAGTQPEIEIKPGTRMYRVAQDIAYGTLTMSDFNRIYGRAMGNAATKAAIYDTARLLNPDFSPAKFELDYKMAANPQIRQRIVAIDGLGPIIEKIKEISSKVGNGDVQAFNRLLQGAKLQVSNKTVANFQQLKTLLGDEAGLALGVGTGSDLKTKLGLDLVNTNLSDGSFQSNMDQLDSILGARKGLLLKQMGTYASAAGGNAPPTAPAPTGLPPVPVGMIRAFDPSGQPHLAKQGTPLPAGWTLAQ